MNAFQLCQNTDDLVPFYLPQQLYLKPIARINMSIQLPNVKKLGKTVSHWEIMDKIKLLIRPDEFTILKVTKTTVEFIRFEGEVETKDKIEKVVSKINNRTIKLKDFSDLMRIKAAEWKSDFPHRRMWDDFFSSAKDMDEMIPGQRPDTIHITNLPSKWFVPYHLSSEDDVIPSEKIFYRAFEKFGSIRYVDIPICDPYRKKMKEQISGLRATSFERTEFFEGYVQFKDYIGFTRTLDALRNMKLVHKEDDSAIEVSIKVDFDKTKHLSDASIRRREIVRDRLVKKAKEKEDKDKADLEEKKKKEQQQRQQELDLKEQKKIRRKLREEKRKAKILEKLEISGSDEINEKIAKEEKKLLRVQRKLEAIRLVEELFRRIQDKNSDLDNSSIRSRDELKNLKNASELEVLNQREKLHNALKGRVMLKTILADSTRTKNYSSSSSEISLDMPIHPTDQQPRSPVLQKYPELMYEAPPWLGYPPYIHPGQLFQDYHQIGAYIPRGRGFPRYPNFPGPSRGGANRRRGGYRYRGNRSGNNYNHYNPEFEEPYQKHFSKFENEHDDRNKRSRRRSRSRSYSRRSLSRSRSWSKTRKRSRSRRSKSRNHLSRSRSYSRSKSRSRNSYSRSNHRGRSRTKSRDRWRSRSRSPSKHRNRTKSRSKSKDKTRGGRSQRSKTKEADKSSKKIISRSHSREKSVDSSSFMTPKQLSEKRADSKSWSSPKGGIEKERSWSKSPEKVD